MHEASLVRSLLNQVAALLAEHGGSGVERVRVEIGPLSGVEPALVRSAFERLTTGGPSVGAQLTIDEVPLSGRCRECDSEFEIERFRFVCPSCESTAVQVTRGDEFRLIDVTIREDHAPQEAAS